MKIPRLALVLVPLLAACAAAPPPREAPARGQDPMTDENALVLYCAGLDELLVDSRDEGLRRALGMVDDRLLELPAEFGLEGVPLPALRLLFDVLGAPLSLRVDPRPGADWSRGPQVDVQLTVHGSEEDLRSMDSRLGELVGQMIPAEPTAAQTPGLHVLPFPEGAITYGVPEGGEPGLVLCLGEPDLGALGLGSLDLPAGVEPALACKLDVGRLRPALDALFRMAGPDAEMVRRQCETLGLLGEDPLLITAAVGHGSDRLWFASRTRNYASLAARTGTLVTEPLTPAELRMIPADATAASLYKSNPAAVLTMLETMAPEEEMDLAGMVKDVVGIDLEKDLFDHLGTTGGMYLSETTGAGGLASFVAFQSVTGPDELEETAGFLQELINGLAANEAKGYVRIRSWSHGEVACRSLTFPGLPVPLELSCALAEGWFLLAATPQGLMAAIDHAAADTPGLTESAKFRAAAVGSLDDLLSLSFTDTPAALADGYGPMSLFAAALANGVRSPEDPARDPGPVLPPYRTLHAGARPSVLVSRLEGEDLVTLGEGDSSLLVNATASLGSSVGKLFLVGFGLGALLPILIARESGGMAGGPF